MIKKLFMTILGCVTLSQASAQITITTADMPVSGDTVFL